MKRRTSRWMFDTHYTDGAVEDVRGRSSLHDLESRTTNHGSVLPAVRYPDLGVPSWRTHSELRFATWSWIGPLSFKEEYINVQGNDGNPADRPAETGA